MQYNWKIRLIWTGLVSVVFFFALKVWKAFEAPVLAGVGVKQLEDSVVSSGIVNLLSTGQVGNLMSLAWLIIMIIIWFPGLKKATQSKTAVTILAFATLTQLVACMGPAMIEPIEIIETNETAFVVPLEGESKKEQGKFMSREFLELAKVPTKRVTIKVKERSTGRAYWDYEWIPTMRVIKVDRSPVTREWTIKDTTGTAVVDQAIHVESLDSINFGVGVNITVFVSEEQAATFLYHFAGKKLSEVVDTNVRGVVQGIMAREFGKRKLDKCKAEKNSVYAVAFTETAAHFEPLGITISSLGNAEGLRYDDPNIQKVINDAFVAENDKTVATNEQAAQTIRNTTDVSRATAARLAAEQFAKAKDAQVSKTELDIRLINANANLEFAKRVSGNLPNILPSNSPLLFNFATPQGKQ